MWQLWGEPQGPNVRVYVKKKCRARALIENVLEIKLTLIFNNEFAPERRSDRRRTPVGVGGRNERL